MPTKNIAKHILHRFQKHANCIWLYNLKKFKRIFVIFGKQNQETNAKLTILLLSASLNYMHCYFTLPNEVVAVL